jgi:hypothetical protein
MKFNRLLALTFLVLACEPEPGQEIDTFRSVYYEEFWSSEIYASEILVITRYPEDGVGYPDAVEPHAEIEVTAYPSDGNPNGGSLHVFGRPEDLRRWCRVFEGAADALEVPR